MAASYPIVPGVTFKLVPGTDIYCVGDDGSGWSRYGRGALKTLGEWRRLKPVRAGRGYLTIRIVTDGKAVRRYLHKLVLEAFVGPCPDGQEVRHFPDRDITNNRLENLKYGTKLENAADREIQGTSLRGADSPVAKLTEADVIAMVQAVKAGETQVAVAARYGVAPGNIRCFLIGRSWSHLGLADPSRVKSVRQLSAEDAIEMRRMRASGATNKEIARAFGICPTSVSRKLSAKPRPKKQVCRPD